MKTLTLIDWLFREGQRLRECKGRSYCDEQDSSGKKCRFAKYCIPKKEAKP